MNLRLSFLLFDISCILCPISQDIIRLPRIFSFLQKPLAQFVSVLRAPKSREGYASIGGGSPLRRITDAQACHFLLFIYFPFDYDLYFSLR